MAALAWYAEALGSILALKENKSCLYKINIESEVWGLITEELTLIMH